MCRILRFALSRAGDDAIDEGRQVACEQFGARLVVSGEWHPRRATLQVQYAARRIVADRHAQHGGDLLEAHALATLEARVFERRGGVDGVTLPRLGDDPLRDFGANLGELLAGKTVRRPPRRLARPATLVVQLEVSLPHLGDFDEQGECLLEKRAELLLMAERQEAQVELAFLA